MTLAEKFSKAYQDSKNLSVKPSNDTLLKLYSHYKQATVGNCNTERPGAFDPVGQAKYDAWKAVEGTSKNEAMLIYIETVRSCKMTEGVS